MVFYGAQVTDSKITWLDGSEEETIHLTNACLTIPGRKRNGRIVLQICDEDAEDSNDSGGNSLSIAMGVLRNNTAENVRLDILINSRMGLRLAGDSAGAVVDVVGNEMVPCSDDEEMAHEDSMEIANLANVARMLNDGNVVFADADDDDSDDDGHSDESDEDEDSDEEDGVSGGNQMGSRATRRGANGASSDKEKGKVVVRGKSNGLPIVTHKSGVKFQDMIIGSGKKVVRGHNVALHYTLRLENGKLIDKADRKRPFKFRLGIGECVKGFDIGVTGMREGGERHLIIPPHLGYGNQSPPGIPRNSTLYFDVGVVKAF